MSYATGVSVEDMQEAPRRWPEAALAHQLALYLCHVAFELSLARVAQAFERDRSTVARTCQIIEDKRDDERFDTWIASLETMLREAAAFGDPGPLAATS